ncbi:MAG: hypothetical protein OWQ48_04390 [Desulfurococcus sp.]|nr:hypothetical protein [Desulfurococcus sp.]
MRLAEVLLKGYNAVVSGYFNIKIRLLAEILSTLGSRGNTMLLDPYKLLEKSGLQVPLREYSTAHPGECDLLIVFEPSGEINLLELAEECSSILVFTTPGSSVRIPGFFNRITISRASSGVFIARIRGQRRVVRLRLDEDRVHVVEKPEGVYARALEVIAGMLSEHGEILVGDAVRAVSHELGVNRREARLIIYKLVEEGYLRIKHGRVEAVK